MSRDLVTLVIPARTEYLIVARLALAGIARGTPIDDGALADLKLAVTEACGNAIRHAQPTDHGVVKVDFDLDDGTIEIRVADTGYGLTLEDQRRLFTKYGRFHRDRGIPGTGLGLYISKAIVEAHGGRIDVESAPGRGTTFTVRLPGDTGLAS